MKYIVTSGCSFTRQYRRIGITGTADDFMDDCLTMWRWPHFIQKEYPEFKVLNYGNPTNDNSTILQSTIYGVEKLLKNGVSPNDIKIIIQWSDWSRHSAFISKDKQKEKNYFLNKEFVKERDKNTYPLMENFAHVNDFIDVEKNYIGEHGYFILSGGYHASHVNVRSIDYFDDYVDHVFSPDERLIEYFKNILFLQYYCKSNGIDYKCFTMHNNFSLEYTEDAPFPQFRPNGSKKDSSWHIVMEKYIPVTWSSDLKYQYEDRPYVKYLYDLIDFGKFWFYEKENITKFGGQVEWCIKNYDINEVSDDEDFPNIIWHEYRTTWNSGKRSIEDMLEYFKTNHFWQHASPYANRKFVRTELKKFLGEPIKRELKEALDKPTKKII
jgi:hypothetical protein